MAISGKIYKEFSTASQLNQLTEFKLKAAGVDSKDERKMVMTALRKAGYGLSEKNSNRLQAHSGPVPGPSTAFPLSALETVTTPSKRKRKHVQATNEFLPDGPVDEASKYGSLEFDEILDEDLLISKSTVINRAPLMTAWSTIVAERMGFKREEALSIASAYTELNAISKGVSLGIFEEAKQKGLEAAKDGSQPYVALMGRRVPLFKTQASQWRALLGGTPAQPSTAFSYISRAFRQTTPHIIGALRLLAESFSPQEVNEKGWGLYCEFRPASEGWGQRAEVRCETILKLRNKNKIPISAEQPKKGIEDIVNYDIFEVGEGEPESKKARSLTLEEYEAELDKEPLGDISLDFDGS